MLGYDTEGLLYTGGVICWGGLYRDMMYGGVICRDWTVWEGVIHRVILYRGMVYGGRYLVGELCGAMIHRARLYSRVIQGSDV